MMASIRRLWLSPVFLVGLAVLLTAFLVQSGELGTSDTTERLQTTHSWWTPAPAVSPDDYPDFGIHGRGGKLYSWYGIGQSLIMLPSDIVGTYLARWPAFSYYDDDPAVRSIVVSYSTNILVCLLTALVCLRLLRLFEFSINQQIAAVLALLFCTTFLHYTQNMMENNYILLLTLAGVTFQYEWLRTGSRRALVIGSVALGANLLTRVTTGLDMLAVILFLVLTSWLMGVRGRALRASFYEYAKVAVPIFAIFGLLDRAYQYYRFGSFFNTYIQVFGREQKMLNSDLPAAYPFETPFHVGFFGALFTPEKSIFLFDPLLVLAGIVGVLAWKRFRPEIRAYFVAFVALLFAYVSFYARYTDWSGDFAWGDRYVSTAAQIVAFISVPLLMRHRAHLGKFVWRLGMALVAISVVVQVSSVMFWCPIEIYQMETFGHPTFVIALRLKNILAFSLGKMNQWGLMTDGMREDPWDYAHITAFDFLPFLLARVGKAAVWVVRLSKTVWFTALAADIALLVHICNRALGEKFDATSEFQEHS
jgi:hypothetical protein